MVYRQVNAAVRSMIASRPGSPAPFWRLRSAPSFTHKQLLQFQTLLIVHPSPPYSLLHFLPDFLSRFARSRHVSHASLLLRHFSAFRPSSLWKHFLRSTPYHHPHARSLLLLLCHAVAHQDLLPDWATLTLLIPRCAALPEASDVFGSFIHCQILAAGLTPDRVLMTGLLTYYSKCGDLPSAKKVFAEMPGKDVIAHNAMIAALSCHGLAEDARTLFDQMCERSSASWSSIITCYCKLGYLDSARQLFDRNPIKDVVSWNAMIDGYCKMGNLGKARELFDQMGTLKDAVTWNTLMSGYSHHREFGVAITLFQLMQMENVNPTEVTMASLLSACAHLGASHMGRWIHAYIQNHRLTIDLVLGNALIVMYFKCGDVETALSVFHGMPIRNIFCWNSVIAGLGMNGHGQQAVEMFLDMNRIERIKPDGVTFVGLLSACSHSGLVAEGKQYFSQMLHIYGVEPQIEHYGCMVDILGRAGFLEDALRLLETMPVRPNAIVWGSLLRACHIHGDSKVSEQVTQHLLELDPNDEANYHLPGVGMMKRDAGSGCSSIEVNSSHHEFLVGDSSHPQFEQIYDFLAGIEKELRELGYRPNTDSALPHLEDEKENEVTCHSEKFAIAFGISHQYTRESATLSCGKLENMLLENLNGD